MISCNNSSLIMILQNQPIVATARHVYGEQMLEVVFFNYITGGGSYAHVLKV